MTPYEYFKQICRIPHGSGNESAIADYIESIANENGLFCIRDDLNNVFVRKNASVGMENKKPVLFAAHTDMVCEKLPSSTHDFEKDPLTLIEQDGFVRANGTTLGADDGAGVAIMLSLMTDTTLIAPVTEYLFTTTEETGMYGAIGFDYSHVVSQKVINLDTGDENGVCISCASGYRYNLKLPLDRTPKCGKAVTIAVCGLAGGHSGCEIDTGRQSAPKLLGILLDRIYSEYPFHIVQIKCGGKANVIAPSAEATVIFYDANDEKMAKTIISEFEKDYRASLISVDAKKFKTAFKKLNSSENSTLPDMLTLKSTSAVISVLLLSPQGVINRFPATREVEASINLGIIESYEDNVTFSFLARSSSKRSDKEMESILKRLAHVTNGYIELESYHGCWEYKLNTPLQSDYKEAYSTVFPGSPSFFATHAGLECGTFYEKLSALGKTPDIISIGPNMIDIHTPKERLEIASLDRVYKVITLLLGNTEKDTI